MNKLIVLSALLILLVLPMISADMIAPGYRPIEIQNRITNINDFSDYVFVSVGSLGELGGSMCPVFNVSNEGLIMDYYKFCRVSVYAIKKNDFNASQIVGYDDRQGYNETFAKQRSLNLENYLTSKGIKVIDNVRGYDEVPISSTQNNVINYYIVDLPKTLIEPTRTEVGRNNFIYLYSGAAVLALIIIICIILYKRKK